MVKFRFIYNADQIEISSSIVVGIVEISFEESIEYVPAYLIQTVVGFIVIFEAGNKVRTVSIQSPRLKEYSRLITVNNKNIGLINFNLGDQQGVDFYYLTGLIFPGLPSKLYDDSLYNIAFPEKLVSGFNQFNISELVFSPKEEIWEDDFNYFALKLNEILKLDIKVLGSYVLALIECAQTISNDVEQATKSKARSIVVNNNIVKAQKVKEQFANYLSSLENTETNVPTIKVVEQEAQKLLLPCSEENNTIKTDDQVKTKETVINTINTNNTEENKTMDFQAISLMTEQEQVKAMETFAPEDFEAFASYVAANEDEINRSAPILNTNKNTEVKPMTMKNSLCDQYRAQQVAQANDEEAYYAALEAQEDNTVAAANGQAKAEEIVEETTNTNSIPNNKVMDKPKTSSRKLVSIELVVNIIAAIGGDCARKSHSVAKRTEKLNVLRNKNSKTISNVRGYGAIRTNGNDGSCFLDVNVFPETAMTVYNTNNRPVIIFHYDDNTQAIQSEANTEKFWRKVLHTNEETVIPFINPTLKVDLPAGADVLCERIDAGTIQAVSVKFTNMDKKMFTYYSSDVSGRYVVYLKAAGDYDVTLLRDTVETSDNFLNYNGEKGAVNNFAGASKTGRSGNNVAVVARPQVKAAVAGAAAMFEVGIPKAVETVVPVAVVVDTEKETLRAENVALKAEVSELKTRISGLDAKLDETNALLAQLIAAQAVKTQEVSIPEIIEIVAPEAPAEVVETEQEQLARLEKERNDFFRACEFDNFEATGEEALDRDQRDELDVMDAKIADLKWLMTVPVADRAAAIEARRLEKEEDDRKSVEAYNDFITTGKVSDNVFM